MLSKSYKIEKRLIFNFIILKNMSKAPIPTPPSQISIFVIHDFEIKVILKNKNDKIAIFVASNHNCKHKDYKNVHKFYFSVTDLMKHVRHWNLMLGTSSTLLLLHNHEK